MLLSIVLGLTLILDVLIIIVFINLRKVLSTISAILQSDNEQIILLTNELLRQTTVLAAQQDEGNHTTH